MSTEKREPYRGRNGVDWDAELEYIKEIDRKAGREQPAQTEGGEKPQVCRNPNHFHTDGSPSEHEIGSSCMAEPVSPPAQPAAFNKYFVEKTQEGWAIFYKEPNAPETGKACIGGSTDEQIARLRCRILNSHISNVIDAVDFAKTLERLTSRCLCVGEWKAGCPVHDRPAQPAGGAREWRLRMDLLGVSQHDFWDDMRAQGYAAEQVRQRDEAAESCVADLLTEVTQLRQERDALKQRLADDYSAEAVRMERESRERAEKALRELQERVRVAIDRIEGPGGVLASLKSSEGAK